jgi:hypothetical protein
VAFRCGGVTEGKTRGVACMRDGRVLLLTDKALYVLAPHGDGFKVAASTKSPGAFRLVPVSDGLYVSGTLASSKTKVYVFGVHGDDVRVLAKLTLAVNPYSLDAVGGRAFGTVDDADETYEIVNLGEAFGAAFRTADGKAKQDGKPKAKAAAAPAKAAKAGPIKVRAQKQPRILWMELERAGVEGVASCELDASGSLVGLAEGGAGYRVVRADRDGAITHADLPAGDFGLSAREDGAFAIACGAPGLYEVDLATMGVTKLAADARAEFAAYVGDDVVVVEGQAVVLCRREGARLVERMRAKLPEMAFALGARGRVVVVPTDAKDKTPVFVAGDGELRLAGHVKEQVNAATGCGELLLLSGQKGTYELDPASVT